MSFRRLLLRRLSSVSGGGAPLLYSHADDGIGTVALDILSWGRGASGQLGGGREEIRLYPSPVASLLLRSSFSLAPIPGRLLPDRHDSLEVGISCGLFHSAVLVGGKFWIWGKGDGGRLGFGDEDSVFVPVENEGIEGGVRSLALGGLHSAALSRSGEIFTWGYGGFGALGHSVYHRELLPKRVNGPWDEKIVHLSTSGAHTAAITESGELYIWGRDEGEGRLGLGSSRGPGEAGSYSVPSKVDSLPVPVAAVSCGGFFTMVLTSDGQVWSWGANSNFELGRGNKISNWRPQPIPNLDNIIQVASGGYHSLALTDQGQVLSWGHGGHGQLGHPSNYSQKVPSIVEALANERIVYIACGGSSSAAVSDTGKLFMWGNSRDHQLGVPGLRDIQPLPVEVIFLMDNERLGRHHVIAVGVGSSHAMCLAIRKPGDSEVGGGDG